MIYISIIATVAISFLAIVGLVVLINKIVFWGKQVYWYGGEDTGGLCYLCRAGEEHQECVDYNGRRLVFPVI